MRITRLIKITAGRCHGWYETDQGFNVRKPLGSVDAGIGVYGARASPASESSGMDEAKGDLSSHPAQKSRWQRFKEWIIKMYRFTLQQGLKAKFL